MHLSRHGIARVIACATVLAFACLPATAWAAPSASVQREARDARARISAMQSELGSAMSRYDSAADALAKTRAEIAANRALLADLRASMDAGQRRLSAEVNFLYRTDGNGFAEALLSSPSIEDFASRLLALSRIANRDAAIIAGVRRDRAAATRLGQTLAARESAQSALVAEVSSRRDKAQSAIARQQLYADSLSAKVSAVLQAQSGNAGPKSPTKPPANRMSVAWARVDKRAGKYAVLAGQPKKYAPSGITFTGLATWYGNVRPNMRTASGRAFNENELTCAHKTLPFGTRVAVTFRGRSVIVVVTDRGPYGRGRVIDLSKRAASLIGLRSAGVGKARCEVVRAN